MDIILPIAAIIALSLFFSKQFKLSPAASPLFAIALITVFLCLMGMINLLVAGVYVIYTAAVLGLVYVFFVKRYSFFEVMQEYLSVGVIFFIVGVVFFYFLLKSKNAIFRDWDEFSFWGVAAKTVFYYDKLYTFVPVSSPLAYPPALPVFSYFIQFFSRKFIEYRTYVAYDIMIVAALAPMFSRVRFENAITTISLTAFSFTGIYAFFHASEGLRAYATSYADMQIGFLFAGSLLMWYSDNKPKGVRYIGSLLVLMVLTLCKDMGLAVAFVAAAVMVVDMLISRTFPSDSLATRNEFFRRYAAVLLLAVISVPLFLLVGVIWGVAALILAVIVFFTIFYMKKLTKLVEQQGPVILRVVSILLLFIGIILIYRVWGIHYQTLKSVSRDAVYVYSIKDVLSGQNVVFNLVYEEMMFRFFNHSIICFGTIAEMLVVFTLIPIVISLFSWNASKILRVSALSILLSLGFIAYYLFHAYLFTTQFPNTYFYENTGAVELMSFNRYISSYAIGHMFAIGGILFLEVAKPFFKTKMLTFTFALVVSISLILSIFYYTPEH
ncbi:MAG: hypothetical protein FWG21_01270, partial [Oscillospiraceae bacterium]|nr:hypothetical protein [Oscillospiraceae bacterium]